MHGTEILQELGHFDYITYDCTGRDLPHDSVLCAKCFLSSDPDRIYDYAKQCLDVVVPAIPCDDCGKQITYQE